MGWIKRHSYFYPQGPDTVETILPIPGSEVPEQLREWPGLKRRCDLYAGRLMNSWLTRSESLQGELSRTVKSWIDSYVPYSVVQFQEWTWVAFKRKELVERTTGHGNGILVPLNEPLAAPPNGFPLHKNPEIEEFVHVFRNICGDIPPTNLLWSYDSAPSLLCGGPHGSTWDQWENSLPLLFDGASYFVVARRDGKVGMFSQESASPPPPKLMKPNEVVQFLRRLLRLDVVREW